MTVRHVTLSADTPQTITFDESHNKFLVKNLTTGNVKVAFGEMIGDVDFTTIPFDCFEVIYDTADSCADCFKHDKITLSADVAGDVEVRVIC